MSSAEPVPASQSPTAQSLATRSGPALGSVLAHRRWVRRSRPFPHVVAQNVFTESVYRELDGYVRDVLRDRPEAFARTMPGYDASGSTLDRHRDGPLGVFASRAWHDAVAGAAAVRATGDITGSLHHHEPGSASGWPHNDLNPGWFAATPPDRDATAMPVDGGVDYHRGPAPGTAARQTVRAVSVLFYLANEPWHPGDGGETGLFASAGAASLAAAVPPVNNSLVLFECTPFSWHTFLSNVRRPRNSLVMWLHRDRDEAVRRWGADSIVPWSRG